MLWVRPNQFITVLTPGEFGRDSNIQYVLKTNRVGMIIEGWRERV